MLLQDLYVRCGPSSPKSPAFAGMEQAVPLKFGVLPIPPASPMQCPSPTFLHLFDVGLLVDPAGTMLKAPQVRNRAALLARLD